MKKAFHLLVTACVMIALCAGCGGDQKTEEFDIVPTIFADITDIPQDKVVMTVGESEITAELYFYWMCYVCGSLEYNILSDYSKYGMYSSCVNSETMTIDWTADLAGVPLLEYARSQTAETIKYYIGIENLAAEEGVSLTQEDQEAMASDLQSAIEEMGGRDEFSSYLEMLGITKENYDRISATSYLYENLLNLVFTEGSDLYLTDSDYNDYATYADHILIATQDMQTGEILTPEESMDQYLLAEDLLEQLRASDDPQTLFDELADEYSEDPGRQQNPTGYIYTPGSMLPEFESAAAQLAPGEISDIVQTDYGFHIIMRRDLLAALEEDESRKVDIAEEYLNELLVERNGTVSVTYDSCLDDVDWDTFYTTYIARVDEMSA